ncbi:MAG: efflux RND transporter periplasmic adaptor subunit [Akkermansia sp.]|nr:efflux RND transporter periplasmic adaptor subunit [Akkermansia sp.]MBQ7023994.1 efflux RND transporter periplasmic adaptor subunit [Akkermansia sp.]
MNAIVKWGLGAAVLGGGAAAWYYWPGSNTGSMTTFSTVEVVRDNFVNKVQATGTLEPQELVDVGAQVTGEIKEFGVDLAGNRVDYGSEVKAGQLLARIDDTIVELDIKRAEASVAQAKAQILTANANISQAEVNKKKADRDLERARKLGVGDALSQMDFDQYLTQAENAAASLESAQAQLANAEAQLQSANAMLESELRNRDYTRITTPVDGTIVVRQVNVGQTVVSNMSATTLFLVARDLRKMQIWASVNEADIAKVHAGQEVRYTVDALPNESFTGVVNKIRPNATMSSNVVTYIVEVDIENPDRKLLPYMSANANFIVKEVKDCLMVPEAAFDFRPTKEQVDPAFADKVRRPGPRPAEGEAPAAERPESAADGEPAMVWVKKGDKVAPVRVLRGESDGTRSIVTPLPGETLEAGDMLVTGVRTVSAVAAKGGQQQGGLFGMNGPKRRQRGAGGVEAKPGQNANAHPGGPPM